MASGDRVTSRGMPWRQMTMGKSAGRNVIAGQQNVIAGQQAVRRLVSTVVLDENTLLREGLKHVLAGSYFRIVKDGPGGEHISRDDLPIRTRDLLFLIGAGERPWEVVSRVRSLKVEYPNATVVVLGEAIEARVVLAAIDAGASGFLRSTVMREILVRSLELTMLGQTVVPTQVLKMMCDRVLGATATGREHVSLPPSPTVIANDFGKHAHRPFSIREAAVLNSLMHGESNKSIARTLRIAEATVKVHVKAILRKIDVKNRTQAALWAAIQERSHDGREHPPWQGSNRSPCTTIRRRCVNPR